MHQTPQVKKQHELCDQDDGALAFARRHVGIDSVEVVSDRPWARTLRLRNVPRTHYLKIVPRQQAAVMGPIAALAGHFAATIPKVMAADGSRGWLLSAEHDGTKLEFHSDPQHLQSLVRTYARIQAECAARPALCAGLPAFELATVSARLLAFLQPSRGNDVGADFFIGARDAAAYRRSLERRIDLLQKHLQPAAGLPPTLNHGDLRPANAAVRSDGSCILLDWDDAMVGPAGLSLHGMFAGCAAPTILLSGSAAAQAAAHTPGAQLIQAYVGELAAAGYADTATLTRSLPAAMCAGMMQFILNFGNYPGESVREAAGETIDARLGDLLDLCDWLGVRNETSALALAKDYEDHGHWRRAERILTDHVIRHPEDVDALTRLGAAQRHRGHLDDAAETLREAIQDHSQSASLHAELGQVLLEQLELDDAARGFAAALAIDPASAAAQTGLARAKAMLAMQTQAELPTTMPTVSFEPGEYRQGSPRPELVSLAASLFETHGTLQIDNAFSPEAIGRLHEAFMARYTPYFREDDHPDALYLGDKRYMVTVDLEDPFDNPDVMGMPMVMPIVRELLGDNCTLGAYTAVISLPGSSNQRLHKDHPPLFPDTEWHHTLPCFAAQVIIPLVPLNEMTGTTRFYKGSHRIDTDDAADQLGYQDPVVPVGSCLLNDYRCAHQGLGNRSDQVRPILTLVFHRRWFHDFKNYSQQPPLRMTDAAYARLPESMRPLLSVWKESREHQRLAQRQR
jgi:tetratricopeptide (TPR) repeat protein